MVKKADLNRTRKLVKGLEFPSRPTVMLEVMKATNSFAPDQRLVADIIRRDIVLASKVLEEANSNLPGYKRRIASVEQAVLLLGLPRVRAVVTQLFLSASLVGKDSPMQKLRHRCVAVGRVAARVAQSLPRVSPAFQSGYLPAVDPEEAYLLGMFHDCGISLLFQKFADYESFFNEARESGGQTTLLGAERRQYQTDHSLIGYVLCEQWQLPPHLCEVIRDHHQLRGFAKAGKKVANRRRIALILVLKLAEKFTGEMTAEEWLDLQEEVLAALGMDAVAVDRLGDGLEADKVVEAEPATSGAEA